MVRRELLCSVRGGDAAGQLKDPPVERRDRSTTAMIELMPSHLSDGHKADQMQRQRFPPDGGTARPRPRRWTRSKDAIKGIDLKPAVGYDGVQSAVSRDVT